MGGGGGGDILPWRGTDCPSVDCPGGHVEQIRT